MKKILVVVHRLSVSSGLTSFYMNYYTCMKDLDYRIDFLQTRNEETPYAQLIEQNGGKIYTLPHYKNNKDVQLYKYVFELFKNGGYSVVHVNISDFLAVLILFFAFVCRVKFRVFHSHTTRRVTSNRKTNLHYGICDKLCVLLANRFLACTERAGKEIFGNAKFRIIKNAIYPQKFAFDMQAREKIREDYGIRDALVIGTVCRQAPEKNPFFMIDILRYANQNHKMTYLLWVGLGPLYDDVIAYAKELGVEDKLIMVGSREDVYRWYSAMDVFMMPSVYEGFGMVYIEAQASGVPTFASDCVPRDSQVTDLMHYLSLDLSAIEWAALINEIVEKENARSSRVEEVVNSGYGIDQSTNALRDYYDELLG